MRPRLVSLALAAAVLAATGAALAGTPKRTFSVSPARQFVTLPIRIAGAHWPRGARCTGTVRVSVRMPSGRTLVLGRPRLKTDGSFRTSWRSPVGTGGHTLRLTAVESCGRAGTVTASRTVQVLPTP